MFTSCPGCARQYRIRAEQLTAAKGQVKCGFCGQQFSALERLSDNPLPLPVQKFPAGLSEPAAETLQSEVASHAFEHEPQFEIPRQPVLKSTKTSGVHSRADFHLTANIDGLPDELQEVLLEESEPPRSRIGAFFWGLGALLLIVAIAAQLAWFNRDYLLRQYPEIMPWAKQICERLGCDLLRQRNVSAIEILNRDVRLHPIYTDSLLVNATMANRSDSIQPFPRIQFTLFDTNGQMVAFREFTPGEYLDDSIAINDGMQPEQPVHFVLEVTGPTNSAVSFEFRFL